MGDVDWCTWGDCPKYSCQHCRDGKKIVVTYRQRPASTASNEARRVARRDFRTECDVLMTATWDSKCGGCGEQILAGATQVAKVRGLWRCLPCARKIIRDFDYLEAWLAGDVP